VYQGLQGVSQHLATQQVGLGLGGVDALAGRGAAFAALELEDEAALELHGSLRKLIKELAYQSCFEEADFQTAHVAVLAAMPPALAATVLRNIIAQSHLHFAKAKRREIRSPAHFLLGVLQNATRTTHLQHAGGVLQHAGGVGAMVGTDLGSHLGGGCNTLDVNAQMVERLREQIRGLGATPDL
jgi:hypothetical protein